MVRWLFILLGLVAWGCASQPVATVESGQPADSKRQVLVATQNSKFKQAVVSEIHSQLKRNAVYLKIIDVKRLKNHSTSEFSAIVIINRCMAGRPDPRVESFIDSEPRKNKVIVLTTGIGDSWKPDAPEVDAITSASALDESDRVASSIVARVMAMVSSPSATP